MLHPFSAGAAQHKLEALCNLAILCRRLLDATALEQHAAAIMHDGALLASLFEQLVPALQTLTVVLQLPTEQRTARYPGLRWFHAGEVAALLTHESLISQLKAYLTAGDDISSSAPRLLQAACQLATQAPLKFPADMAAWQRRIAWCSFVDLASQILSHLTGAVHDRHLIPGGWSWDERLQRVAAALLAALPGIVSALHAQHAATADAATSPGEVSCSLGRCLYMAMFLLQALASTDSTQAGSPFSSQAAAVPWCDVAPTALRALPAAAELAERDTTPATLKALPNRLLEAAATIALRLRDLAGALALDHQPRAAVARAQPASSPAGSATCPDFPAALFQLHTAACRAAHCMAARAQALPAFPAKALLQLLDRAVAAVARLCETSLSSKSLLQQRRPLLTGRLCKPLPL